MNDLVTIQDVLQHISNFEGWLYLPDKPWDLSTKGVFVVFDKDAKPDHDPIPDVAKNNNWKETLDVASIEDIISNVGMQLSNPSIDDLFRAFQFYFDHDAYLKFSPSNSKGG